MKLYCLTEHKPFFHWSKCSLMYVPAKECSWLEKLIFKLRGFIVVVIPDDRFNATLKYRAEFKGSLVYKLMEEASGSSDSWFKERSK